MDLSSGLGIIYSEKKLTESFHDETLVSPTVGRAWHLGSRKILILSK